MKPLFTSLAILAAAPALAHPGVHMHPHGQEPSLWLPIGLALVLLAAVLGIRQARRS